MIRTPKQAKGEAKRLFELCLVHGKLDSDLARRVVQAAIQSGRRGYLTVLRHFHRLVKLELARHTAEIETAVPLPDDLRGDVRIGLVSLYGSGLNIQFAVKPDLIGGMRIKVGNDVFDESVRSRLNVLARSFGIAGTNGRQRGF